MRADVGHRIDRELRTGTDIHRIDDKGERWNETTRKNCPSLRVSTRDEEWKGKLTLMIQVVEMQGMEVVRKRNDGLEVCVQMNTYPFLNKIYVIAVRIET